MPADYLSRNLVNAISWDSSTLQQAQNADPLLKALKSFLLNKELPHDAKCQSLIKLFANDCFIENDIIWRRIKRQFEPSRVVIFLPASLVPEALSDALLASEKALVQQLREENERLTKLREQDAVLANALIEKNVALSNTCAEVANQNAALAHELVVAKGMPPFIKKESDRTSLVKMIGAAILFLFNIIMYHTQPLTRLHALVEAVFEMEIFGSFQTEKVLKEVSTKYARNTVFLPWKVLKSMDLAINGGINFTGVEALRKIEGLADHQRGFLPSRSSIQKCAAQLHDLGQDLIPFGRVASQLGEMVNFILKRWFDSY